MPKRSSKMSLETQLKSYAACAQAVASDKTPSDARGRWPVYAAAAGSALALSTSATADIFFSGIQNITATAPVGGSIFKSLKTFHTDERLINIGAQQFGLTAQRFTLNFYRYHSHGGAGFVRPVGLGAAVLAISSGTSPVAKRLANGAPISAGAGRFSQGRLPLNFGDTSMVGARRGQFQEGQFASGQPGFAGIRLATGGGKFDYGWIQLEVSDKGGFPNSVTAIDWAYNEVPGESIDAGQETSSTPEPGGRSLALLAAGCLGVLAWRKRRAQRAA